ncbi:AAA family ATPase [Phytoactinopolyspora limicola]|uniref:AAA family ATPase n=1 Tax=Phytoactinopolyspora limicola TaxID=2715536 RepID=UPI003CCDD052
MVEEFQRVPPVLSAIKAELNVDRRPGRYVLTGSARHQVVPELADYLTGRIELLTLWPFAMAELEPGAASIVDRLFDGSLTMQRRATAIDRKALVDLVLRGGCPIAVTLGPPARGRWSRNLVDLVAEGRSRRRVDSAPRDPAELPAAQCCQNRPDTQRRRTRSRCGIGA